jgi:hypothetical protein
MIHLLSLPVNPKLALTGVDMTVGLIGVVLGVSGALFFAGRVLKETLKGLASPAAIKALKPKIGWTLWVSMILSALVTGALYFISAK